MPAVTAAVDDPLGVAEDDVRRLEPDRLDQVEAGDARGARAIADEPRRLDVAAREMNRVDHAGGRDDRRAVLIVVKDRDVHHLAQALFDVEALGRLDVLEIDSAERGAEVLHRIDELVGVFRRDLEVDGIDVGEALEQHRLAFHHRLCGERPEVAEPEDGGAVGDDRDHVAARGVVVDGGGVGGDRLDRNGDARRVGERKIALGRHRLGRHDLELSRPAAGVELERLLVGDGGAFQRSVGLVSHGQFLDLVIGGGRLGRLRPGQAAPARAIAASRANDFSGLRHSCPRQRRRKRLLYDSHTHMVAGRFGERHEAWFRACAGPYGKTLPWACAAISSACLDEPTARAQRSERAHPKGLAHSRDWLSLTR